MRHEGVRLTFLKLFLRFIEFVLRKQNIPVHIVIISLYKVPHIKII